MDAAINTLKKFPENKRAQELLKLLEKPAEIILKSSFLPISWAAFSGPILRASENEEGTIELVRNQMKDCLDNLDASLNSVEPFDSLLDEVIKNNKSSEYFT